MKIQVNGKNHTLPCDLSVEDFLTRLQVDCQQIVIELNQEILPRGKYADIRLQDGDTLEIIHFVGGG